MKWCALAACLFLFGCAATTAGVVESGGNVYKVSRQAATGSPAAKTLQADALKDAKHYCLGLGKTLQVINTSEIRPFYMLGRFQQVNIRFTCVDKPAQ